MTLTVNGERWEVGDEVTVADVVARLAVPDRGVAVAVDGALVRRASWPTTALGDGASVEVLTAVQGG
ncbi:MAG: sulfur carrier protein ThiS [Pseudonocardiaceae bacterium]